MRTKTLLLPFTLVAMGTLIPPAEAAGNAPLTAQAPIQVSAEAKRFDLVTVDAAQHRLLAAHSQAQAFTVLDITTDKLLGEIPVGNKSSGVAIDTADGKYFASTDDGVAVIDSKSLQKTAFIKTSGPTDDMAYDADSHKLYVTHDDGTELWVVDARKDAIIGHIDIPGVPEIMEMDAASHRIYINIKDKNEVAVIDLQKGAVTAVWPAPSTDSPHGLALDLKGGRLYVAGHSPTVSVFSLADGKSLPGINIGDGRVDQIAFDAGTGKLYIPSSGRLVTVDTGTGSVLGDVAINKGTHSVAVDPNTHLVWIVYADEQHSFAQAFAPPKD
ncbi:MAG TPA: YncE family protein [Gammaproteobacteria bacterium]|jgi:DNA-binding beta-propeller fold protein YncE|nr:YncE family protein [Gammaproteobacteria bacterium]